MNNDQIRKLSRQLHTIPARVKLHRLIADKRSTPLDKLHAIAVLADYWNGRIPDAARACREAGHTWDDIAERLGVSRQAVMKRFRAKP